MDVVCKEFGDFLRMKRLERGLTQKEVAKLMDMPQGTYSKYENGYVDAGYTMIIRFSKVLKFDPAEAF